MYEYKALCYQAIDSTTVGLEVDLGFALRLRIRTRLLGIAEFAGPEIGRAREARAYIEFNVVGREVRVKMLKTRDNPKPQVVVFFKTGETWHNLADQLVGLEMASPNKDFGAAVAFQAPE